MKINNKHYYALAVFFLAFVSCKKNDTADSFPTDGLVSYFKFDGNLKDEQGNTPDGINTGMAPFVKGKSGKAISLNGIDQKIVFAKNSFRSGNDLSVAFWVKTVQVNDLNFFLGCSDFYVGAKGEFLSLVISLPNTSSARGAFISDTWTHFVGTYNGTDIKVYINGEIEETMNHPGNISTSISSNLFIGSVSNSYYWAGSLDDLFIYNKTLTQAEVTQLYNLH